MNVSTTTVRSAQRRWLRSVGLALVGALVLLLAAPALADPPGRVGRIGDLQGQAWLYNPNAGEWVMAQRNRPITSGDRLSTERDARVELQIGSTALRLDGASELEIVQLDDDTMRFQLLSGSVAARLRSRESAREFELLTGEGRFRPEQAGRYRFDRIDDASHVTAWRGQVLFEGSGTAVTVQSGQRAEVWKDGRTQYTLTAPVHDAFADWVAGRDQADERSASTRYVSPEMTGVEDLDREGRWEQSPDYGALWIPHRVAPGWAPYRYGHWAFVHPWGWTWVDDARWGFAPFHYGRWVYHRSAWSWAPGTYVHRPVYAPALVAWVGGPHVSLSVSVGSGPRVGWFPLAPREVYVPSYRVSPGYVRNVNATHVTHISNVTNIVNSPHTVVQQTQYANRGLTHAVTVVPSNVVANRQPVGAALVHSVDPRIVRDMTRSPVLLQPPVAAPPIALRNDSGRGTPRERVVNPGFSSTVNPNSNPNLPPVRVPLPSVAQPAVVPTAPPAAQAPAPTRIWRGDEHVGTAPWRVRRGGPDSAPAAGTVPQAPGTSPWRTPGGSTPVPSPAVVQPPTRIVQPTSPPVTPSAAAVAPAIAAPVARIGSPAPPVAVTAPAPAAAPPRAVSPVAPHPPGTVPQQWHGRHGRIEDAARPFNAAPVAAPRAVMPAPAAPLEQPAAKPMRVPGERGAHGRERS